jgi:hypothetical protein
VTHPATPRPIDVRDLMAEVRKRVRADVRARLVREGAAEFEDARVFDAAEQLLHEALQHRDGQALLLPELLDDEDAWRLDPALRLASHRPVVGAVLIWLKRRVLLPLTRWLFDYSRENFARQQRLNLVLMACIQRLAVENARLTARLDQREPRSGADAP